MDKRVLVVDSKGGSEFKTVSDAMRSAVEGDTLLVRSGLYEEKVIMDKSVHVVGEEGVDRNDILISSGLVTTMGGSVKNVAIQQHVDIRSGNVTIDGCDISGGSDGVRVCKDSDPTIRNCRIHGATGGGDGIYFQEGARGVVEGCELFSHRVNGIHVNGAEVVLRHNSIYDCAYGIYFRKGGRGVCEENKVKNISCFGIYIVSGSDPMVRKNDVVNCDIRGLMISQNGSGHISDNRLQATVHVVKGCTPVLGHNDAPRIDNDNSVV